MKEFKEMFRSVGMMAFIVTFLGLFLFTSIVESNKKDLCIRQNVCINQNHEINDSI